MTTVRGDFKKYDHNTRGGKYDQIRGGEIWPQ